MSIRAQPIDSELSTAAIIIQGTSPTYFTCLSSQSGTCNTSVRSNVPENVTNTVNGVTSTTTVTHDITGGFLNTPPPAPIPRA